MTPSSVQAFEFSTTLLQARGKAKQGGWGGEKIHILADVEAMESASGHDL